MNNHMLRVAMTAAALSLAAASLAACSSGQPSGGGDEKVDISFLSPSDEQTATLAKDLAAAFEKENPNITVSIDNFPAGTDGNNVIKTKLSTGTMNDVFFFNSGALMQTLDPDSTLVDLTGEAWQKDVTDDFKSVVSTPKGVYGAPLGSSQAGGIMYNKKVYEQLGLTVPTSWDEFISNSEKIKAAGIAPIIQTYGDPWTSQLIVLGNFANVMAEDPDWAANYTANKAKYADEPALAGFEHLADAYQKGLFNEDFASATNAQGMQMLADGTGAQYPMLTSTIATIVQNSPDSVDDIGFFAVPADDAQYTGATIWQPSALYVPQTTTGDKLVAAKKFVAFVNSAGGCDVQNKDLTPSGPYVTSACTLPDGVPPLIGDVATYFDSGKTAPALEFLVPVTAPNMQSFTVAAGSGISNAKEAAALADQDVATQAQQLGLPGW